jgi:hypothetical protein
MAKLWLTYAWKDNEDQRVDFIIGELAKTGLTVKFDRAHLVPGQRLWDNLDKAITEPGQSDAWAIYATKNSLSSEPCLEELAYALDRALRTHGHQFPLIGIFPEPLDRSIIPSAIATRLYVTLNDAEWAKKVAARAEGNPPEVNTHVEPYIIANHRTGDVVTLELRPRAGRWFPFMVLVPDGEHAMLSAVTHGPHGRPPDACMVARNDVTLENLNGKNYKGVRLQHAVDPLNSAYVQLSAIPSEILFGPEGGRVFQLLKR